MGRLEIQHLVSKYVILHFLHCVIIFVQYYMHLFMFVYIYLCAVSVYQSSLFNLDALVLIVARPAKFHLEKRYILFH